MGAKGWGFTREEILAILFLSSAFALGLFIRWLGPEASPPATGEPAFFAAADSEFAARSRPLLNDPHPRSTTKNPRSGIPPLQPRSIDINAATAAEFVALPGIGEATAARIIQYRTENGPFAQPEDLMEVAGIGPKKFARIEPYLRTR